MFNITTKNREPTRLDCEIYGEFYNLTSFIEQAPEVSINHTGLAAYLFSHVMVYIINLDRSNTASNFTKLTYYDLKMPVPTETTAMAIYHPAPLITVILNGTVEFIELPTQYIQLLFAGYETFGVHRGHKLLPKLIRPPTTAGTMVEEVLLRDDNYHLLGGGDTVRFDFKFGAVRDETDVGSLDLFLMPISRANTLLQDQEATAT